MKKILLSLFSFLVVSVTYLTPETSVFAKTPGFQVQNVSSTLTGVNVSWSEGADHFAIYHDNQLVYQGKNSSFVLKDVTPNTDYKLYIVAYDANDIVIGRSKIQAATPDIQPPHASSKQFYSADSSGNLSFGTDSNGKPVLQKGIPVTSPTNDDKSDAYLDSSFVSTAVNFNSVFLSWDPIPGVKSYQVLRNGTQIGTVENTAFTDPNTQSGQQYTYEIKAYRPMDSVRTEKLNTFIKNNHLILKAQEELAGYNDTFDLVKQVNTSLDTPPTTKAFSSDAPSMLQPAGVPTFPYFQPSFTLKYSAFIPTQYVPNPWNIIGTAGFAYFGGDNRSFDANASTYRTRSSITAAFAAAGKSINMTPSVGQSKGYDSNYNLTGTDYASTSGIMMATPSFGTMTIQYTVNHSIGIPLTTAPAIDYSYSATLYSDGHINLSGWHDQAPDHEIYIYTPYSQTIHQGTVVDYNHLFPTYAKNNWSYSN